MEPIIGNPAGAEAAAGLIVDTTTQTFARDVIEASREVPVIVDFWAPWCGPCKQLTPVLENAVKAARGAVKLVKMNIDEHPAVAQQLRIQSIPAVYAFKNGQPVDGFMGALPESQVKAFIASLAGDTGPSPAEELVAMGREAYEAGDLSRAAQAFAQAVQEEPGNPAAVAGLARCYIDAGDLDRARQTLSLVRPDGRNDPDFAAAEAALSLAEKAGDLGDIEELRAKLDANPKDHQARFDLAMALNARGDKEGAVDELLIIVEYDRNWNDQAARKQLVELFDAYGPKHEATLSGRRRLSSILFS
ncbi:MAG: thioredoxin [Parvibaculum sp.]|jgi:putative thioredoxin|uniref:thioredoxin n=1 Tax=Parvibaculum sp. TaxID=2024848 RepID=UPI000C573F0E|nr:thioredoxin [Parvibaculum sp.]MAU61156.1 thioredoxin [Parvibaculum sp.]|tara:strand:- start:5272 stop:6183 length:912 start_codon:yes stop_codon:yes gene_type:complete